MDNFYAATDDQYAWTVSIGNFSFDSLEAKTGTALTNPRDLEHLTYNLFDKKNDWNNEFPMKTDPVSHRFKLRQLREFLFWGPLTNFFVQEWHLKIHPEMAIAGFSLDSDMSPALRGIDFSQD